MIKRIENWLRQIFSEAVSEAVTADLKQFRADCVAEKLLIAAPQRWQASPEDVKAANEFCDTQDINEVFRRYISPKVWRRESQGL
jgi:hypothetical protein